MADFEELSFEIPAYTPETMPLDLLIEYLQQISAVIGDPSNMHLIKIERSSTKPVLQMPRRVALEAGEKAAQVMRGEGTRAQLVAYDRLRRMVRRDAPTTTRPAKLSTAQKVILEIPPAPDESGALSGVRQATTIDGLLVSIGGVGETAFLKLQILDGKVVAGLSATRSVAKDMAKLIYETIRVSGPGIWARSEDGVWGLERMQIQSYETLDDAPLGQVIADLRDLHVEWPPNADEALAREREAAS